MLGIFAVPLIAQSQTGMREDNQEQSDHGGAAGSMLEFMGTGAFWFRAFQKWQSEFLAVGMLSVLSIFLRQKGSPESKPVADRHARPERPEGLSHRD